MNNAYLHTSPETAKQLNAWASVVQDQMKPYHEQMQETIRKFLSVSSVLESVQQTMTSAIPKSYITPVLSDLAEGWLASSSVTGQLMEADGPYTSLAADLKKQYASIAIPLSTQAILTGIKYSSQDISVTDADEAPFVAEDIETVATFFEKAEQAPEELEAMFSRLSTLEKHVLACFLMVYFQLHAILFPEIMDAMAIVGTYQTIFSFLK